MRKSKENLAANLANQHQLEIGIMKKMQIWLHIFAE